MAMLQPKLLVLIPEVFFSYFEVQGGPIKCYHFSIIHKFSNVNLFKIFIQRFVIRNIKPTFNINEFVKSELCRERNKDLCSVCV